MTINQEKPACKFSSLAIGQEFDFIKPDSIYNSFFERCIKISPRKYESTQSGVEYEIGTVNCIVYNS